MMMDESMKGEFACHFHEACTLETLGVPTPRCCHRRWIRRRSSSSTSTSCLALCRRSFYILLLTSLFAQPFLPASHNFRLVLAKEIVSLTRFRSPKHGNRTETS